MISTRPGLELLILPFSVAVSLSCQDLVDAPGENRGVESVVVSPDDIRLEVGESVQLTATPLDMAGVDFYNKEKCITVKGASGIPVRTLVHLALELAEEPLAS